MFFQKKIHRIYLCIHKGTCLIEKVIFSLILKVILEQCLGLMNLWRGERRKLTFKNHSFSKSVPFSEFTLQFEITQSYKAISSQLLVSKFHTLKIPSPLDTQNGTIFISFRISMKVVFT